MASSKEAFERFGMWKKSRTVLKLTVLTKGGMPNILRGEVASLDEREGLVGFAVTATRDFVTLDFNGASFKIGKRVVEGERRGDLLTFEEDLTISRRPN
jgi:hypothetical protein